MAFTDWDFFSRVTEQTIPSNIQILSETDSFITDTASLNIFDGGNPAVATVVATLKSSLFPPLVEAGRIRTIFERKLGAGFRDQGFYFLTSGKNPTLNGVQGYAVRMTDGGGFLRVAKFTNGLHDFSNFVNLVTYNTPFIGNETGVVEVEWVGGIIAEDLGFTSIETRFGGNTVDFNDLVSQGTITDSSYTSGFTGLWMRSRNSSEPLDSLVDNTSIYERDFI
jgi:hypothetical protein